MYRIPKIPKTTIKVNTSYEGETIEQKMERVFSNKEPITDGAPLVYTERKDGVRPEYDIRTDRFEHAIDLQDKAARAHVAKREERIGEQAKKGMEKENGGAKSTQATDK